MHLQIDTVRARGLHDPEPPGRDRLRHRPPAQGRRHRDPGRRPRCTSWSTCSPWDFIESTGLGALIGGRRRAHALKGSLSLVCNEDQVLKIFRITRPRQGVHDLPDRRRGRRPTAPRRLEPLAVAARQRRPGVVPEAVDEPVALRLVERHRLRLLVPVSSTITSAPASRAVPSRCASTARAYPRRRASGATYIRLTSAASVDPSGRDVRRRRQPPMATAAPSRRPTKNAPRGGSNSPSSSGVSSGPP